MRRRLHAVQAVLGLALLACVLAARRPPSNPAAPAAEGLPVLGRVPGFSLRDSLGRAVGPKNLQGPWVAGFIYTRCSTQCPLMMRGMKRLAADLPSLSLVSFSLDPDDTPAVLRAYAKKNAAPWRFLTGPEGAVERLAVDGFKLAAQKDGRAEPLTHSGYLVLVDAEGRIRGYYDGADEAALARLAAQARSLLR